MKLSLSIRSKKLKKIGNFLKKLPRTFCERAFLTSLILFTIAIILGALVFYKYSILVERVEPKSNQALLQFDENKMQDIVQAWQDRQKTFDDVNAKQYINPFKLIQ
jgi:hypothetical protein